MREQGCRSLRGISGALEEQQVRTEIKVHWRGTQRGNWPSECYRIPGQQRRLRQLAPGAWQKDLARVLAVHPSRPDIVPGYPAVDIAIYPDVVWIAARSLPGATGPGSLQHCEAPR
jgi:hypothetical protein